MRCQGSTSGTGPSCGCGVGAKWQQDDLEHDAVGSAVVVVVPFYLWLPPDSLRWERDWGATFGPTPEFFGRALEMVSGRISPRPK